MRAKFCLLLLLVGCPGEPQGPKPEGCAAYGRSESLVTHVCYTKCKDLVGSTNPCLP